jgi:hypothetical protein
MLYKLKYSEVVEVRLRLLKQQGDRCALCKLPCAEPEAVLDHDHKTGLVRAVLHRGCNSMLGKVENNHSRYGIKNLSAFLNGCAGYLQRHATASTNFIYPTHKTDEEKRLARNAKARKTRAANKRKKQ